MTRRSLTTDDLEELLYGDDFEGHVYTEIEERTVGSSRWMKHVVITFRRNDGTFWQLSFARGLTEMQDNGIEDPELYQVVPKEITVTTYEPA